MADGDLVRLVLSLSAEVQGLRRQVSGMQRFGTVHQVDHESRRLRLNLGDSGNGPYLSPWRPWSEVAGEERSWRPPSEGQQMALLSPFGDMRQGVAIPLTFSNANPAPAQSASERILSRFGSSELSFGDNGGVARLFSDRVDLGAPDGRRVARVGDRVQVASGSSAGLWPIVEGSEKVYSA